MNIDYEKSHFPGFFKKKQSDPIDFSKYSFLQNANAATAENPTASQQAPAGTPGPHTPGAPATNHKYIERKPDPRHPGKYIYIYELPSGKRQFKTESGREIQEIPHLPPHKQNLAQYTHTVANGMDKDAATEFSAAREGIHKITQQHTPKTGHDDLNGIHPTKHNDYVQAHDGKYYNINDFQEGYRSELRKHQDTIQKHIPPHWEHIARALDKGLKIDDEIIDNYPNPAIRAHLQYIRAIHLPEFKEWFGDWENEPFNASKVTDAQGRPSANNHKYEPAAPKVFYHGTPQGGFSKFAKHKDKDFNLFGQGFYFTDNEKVAEAYAKRNEGEAGKVYRNEYRGFTDRYGKEEKFMSYGAVMGALETVKNNNPGHEETDFPHIVAALKKAKTGATFDAQKFFESYYDLNKSYDGEKDREVENIPLLLHPFIEEYTRNSGMKPVKATGQIYQTFLNIRNPFNMEARLLPSSFDMMKKAVTKHFEGGKVNFHKLFEKWDDTYRGQAIKAGFDGYEPTDAKKVTFYHLLKLKQILKDHPKHKAVFSRSGDNELTYTEMHYLLSAGNRDQYFMKRFSNYLKNADYDGISYQGGWENPKKEKHNVYVAFNPKQIKDVSNKTFNPKEESIYKAIQTKLLNPLLRGVLQITKSRTKN